MVAAVGDMAAAAVAAAARTVALDMLLVEVRVIPLQLMYNG